MKNKRATQTLAAVFLVFLASTLIIYSLWRFSVGVNGIKESFSGLAVINKVNEMNLFFENSFYEIFEGSIAEAYSDYVEKGDYIQGKISSTEGVGVFSFVRNEEEINKELSEKILSLSKEKLEKLEKESCNKKQFCEEANLLKRIFLSGNPRVVYNSSGFFVFLNVQRTEVGEGISISYPDIFLRFPYNQIGLESFGKIYFIKEKCSSLKSENSICGCFKENLPFFKVFCRDFAYEKKQIKSFIVSLISKRTFFIEGNLKPISFEFEVRKKVSSKKEG